MGCLARLALALTTNAVALWACDRLFDGVQIHGFWAYAIGAAVLAFANAVIKPVLAILTLPLVILTLGLFYLLIAIGMVCPDRVDRPELLGLGLLGLRRRRVHRLARELGRRDAARPRQPYDDDDHHELGRLSPGRSG